jgi:hypothetical protein
VTRRYNVPEDFDSFDFFEKYLATSSRCIAPAVLDIARADPGFSESSLRTRTRSRTRSRKNIASYSCTRTCTASLRTCTIFKRDIRCVAPAVLAPYTSKFQGEVVLVLSAVLIKTGVPGLTE